MTLDPSLLLALALGVSPFVSSDASLPEPVAEHSASTEQQAKLGAELALAEPDPSPPTPPSPTPEYCPPCGMG